MLHSAVIWLTERLSADTFRNQIQARNVIFTPTPKKNQLTEFATQSAQMQRSTSTAENDKKILTGSRSHVGQNRAATQLEKYDEIWDGKDWN